MSARLVCAECGEPGPRSEAQDGFGWLCDPCDREVELALTDEEG